MFSLNEINNSSFLQEDEHISFIKANQSQIEMDMPFNNEHSFIKDMEQSNRQDKSKISKEQQSFDSIKPQFHSMDENLSFDHSGEFPYPVDLSLYYQKSRFLKN